MTNVVGFETRVSIEVQARKWLIRLDGDEPLTEAEREVLREWMGRSPLHREELARLSKFWRQANVLTELAVPLEQQQYRPAASSGRTRWTIVVVTCIVMTSLLLGWWYLRPFRGAANGSYATAIGQQQTIALFDGSSVQLNTDSQVQVIYSAGLRRLRLLRGEALFSVTPDPKRPFLVDVGDQIVRALGTAFAIRLDAQSVNVTVTSGSVDISGDMRLAPAADSRRTEGRPQRRLGRLEAGQMATFDDAGTRIEVRRLPEPELRRRVAWHEGYLAFSGEPLSEVVAQLNRYSPVTIEIGDPALASIPIGGRFRVGDLDAVLDVLRTNFAIETHQVEDRKIRLDSRPSR